MGGNGDLKPLKDDTTPTTSDDAQPESSSEPVILKHQQPAGRRHSIKRNTPTTLHLRTEEDIERSSIGSPSQSNLDNSNFGITSLASSTASRSDQYQDVVSSTPDATSPVQAHPPVTLTPITTSERPASFVEANSPAPPTPNSLKYSPTRRLSRELAAGELSRPLTPYHLRPLYLQHDRDFPGTPQSVSLRSLRLSDDDAATDDGGSQAIASDDGHMDEEVSQAEPDNAQLFVMPSLRMPTRRPFTEQGKYLGRLKIMITGPRGSGKTSLIRSIVQCCEDIVHVDLLSESASSIIASRHQIVSKSKSDLQLNEILASTRAYPSWWSEFEDDNMTKKRRRTSINEPILERNISFIDTPAFDSSSARTESIALQYLEQQLDLNSAFAYLTDSEILNTLGTTGGTHVDLVLYIIQPDISEDDLQHLKLISDLSNIVPVISKSDLLSDSEMQEAVNIIEKKLLDAGIRVLNLQESTNDLLTIDDTKIWTVSSATLRDDDMMDASLLMNSQYVQPLASSTLPTLVSAIFHPDTAGRLRHLAAKKYLEWHRAKLPFTNLPKPGFPRSKSEDADLLTLKRPLDRPSRFSTPSSSHVLVSRTIDAKDQLPASATSPYTFTRLTDHEQREEMLARVHLAQWAVNLQRNLQDERERYEQLKREERETWLLEKWEQHVGETGVAKELLLRARSSSRVDTRDPLGLLAWDDSIRRRGIIIAKVLGSCGIIGAAVVWFMKHCRWPWEGNESLSASGISTQS